MTSSKFPASVNHEIVRTGPHDYGFLNRDTVIDLRQLHAAELSRIVMQPQFAVRGSLTPVHLQSTDEILRAAVTIEQDILDRIVTQPD